MVAARVAQIAAAALEAHPLDLLGDGGAAPREEPVQVAGGDEVRRRDARGAEVGVGPDGADEVELRLLAHPGAPALPLQRGASGGELSRVMLAIEVVFAGSGGPPTLVFDEVDAGVGGQAAVEIGPLPIVQADPLQMRQLIQNLLMNALKFHKLGEPPHVTIRAVTLPGMPHDPPESPPRPAVRIDVIDRGIGFENEFRDRIFEVFQRLHGRNEYEGTGIGLAVVRKIAERHGGFVTADGVPGEGATFSVVLPMRGSKVENNGIVREAAAVTQKE